MERERSFFWTAGAPSLLLLVVVGVAVAGSVTIPNTFIPNSVADANQVNANFGAVATEINDNDARITAIENGTTAAPLDADTLGGLAANQLVRAGYSEILTTLSDFDTATFSTMVSRTSNAPVAGIILAWGTVVANHDTTVNNTDTDLRLRITIGGVVSSIETDTQLSEVIPGNDEVSVTVFGARAVGAGNQSVVLQARETGTSRLDIAHRSLATLFVPFGNAGTQGVLKPSSGGDAEPETTIVEDVEEE